MGQLVNEIPQWESVSLEGQPNTLFLRNHLLLSLPASELQELRHHLEPYRFRQREILYEPPQKLRFVYFPNDGLVSLVATTEDGGTVEAGMVGKEGLVGLASIAGMARCPLRQVVQIPSDGLKIRVAHMQAAIKSAFHFQSVICRYAIIMGTQIAQMAACNRLHDTGQRLARWLLMARDRVDLDSLPVTHDFLANILGTDRPSVSLAAKVLQRQAIIAHKRGVITIRNHRRLESASCECYRIIRSLTQKSPVPQITKTAKSK